MMAVSASGASSAPLASFVKYVPEEMKKQTFINKNKNQAALQAVYRLTWKNKLTSGNLSEMLYIHIQ